MTDKEMRRMSRGELLELLVAQMEENQNLREQLEQAQRQLADRDIKIEQAGSIAQASLALNGVFASAEAAAKQYAENLNRLAREEANEIVSQARQYSAKVHQAADDYLRNRVVEAAGRNGGYTKHHVETQDQNAGADAAAGTGEG